MNAEREAALIAEIKGYVVENLPLNKMEDDELEDKVEEIVRSRVANEYCPITQILSIVNQVYSSIRGFGLLDTIISDDTITEVMINGPENILLSKTVVFLSWINNLRVKEDLKMLYRGLLALPAGRSTRRIRYVTRDFRMALVLMLCCRRSPCAGRQSLFVNSLKLL